MDSGFLRSDFPCMVLVESYHHFHVLPRAYFPQFQSQVGPYIWRTDDSFVNFPLWQCALQLTLYIFIYKVHNVIYYIDVTLLVPFSIVQTSEALNFILLILKTSSDSTIS